MAEQINFSTLSGREERYQEILPQIEAVLIGEDDLIANLANTAAILKEVFGFFWVGFYLVKNEVLVLGPFQGPLACTRISKGKGVCGTAWEENRSILVDDVDLFPGHIACSSDSQSEIVVPITVDGQVVAVLDVDSDKKSDFTEVDMKYLEQVVSILHDSFRTEAQPR